MRVRPLAASARATARAVSAYSGRAPGLDDRKTQTRRARIPAWYGELPSQWVGPDASRVAYIFVAMRATKRSLCFAVILGACGGGGDAPPDAGGGARCDDPPGPFAQGSPPGHADPLGASATEARAGRLTAA